MVDKTISFDEAAPESDPPGERAVAIAIDQDPKGTAAPRVVAKGYGKLAEQILQIAFDRGVNVRSDADLAEILAAVEIDSEVPLEALAAVAEILSYVYRAQNRAFADRLVDVDLLDRAAEVLESQIQYRLQGPEKARVGVRLAVVRLLDQKPAKALHALTMSEARNLPDEMVRERRHLRVRALAALDRSEEALVVLGAGDSPAALRLRTEVLWGQQNWAAVAVLLGQVVPETPPAERPLTEIEAEDVVNLAVALTMIDDRGGLLRLGTNYKETMAQEPHRATFTLLVGDLEPGRIKTIAEELAQVEQVEAFLANYRKRLQQVNLSQLN